MTQIAVKLPDELVDAVDDLVGRGLFKSRSAAVRVALQAVIAGERHRVIDNAYADGYGEVPESEREIAEAARLAIEAIEDEPWERWW